VSETPMIAPVAPAPPPAAGRKAPRWMWAALIASLAVNLLVVGVVVGAGFARPFHGGPASWSLGFNLVRYAMHRSPEMKAETRRILATERPRMQPLRREAREARQAAGEALAANPFDPARFREAQGRVYDVERRLGELSLDGLVAIASQLTAEQRKEFVDSRQMRRSFRRQGEEAPGNGSGRPADARQ